MAENSSSPIFAGRYRFEPVSNDWDIGRTGFTHPAVDLKEKRRVVIKRADVTSPQARQQEHSLQNETKALQELKGLGVPELYDVSQADYGYQHFTYLVMEYIEGIRIEQEISSLNSDERAIILVELFRLLAKAHKRGISNGDIDLKHLFWSKEKQKLVIIDWGNANINSPQKNHQIAFDLARSAEIIYTLMTRDGIIPVTGSLALPDKTKLFPSISPLPDEFYKLCEWAPRNPSEDMHSPFTALELYIAAQKWISRLNPKHQSNDVELDTLIITRPQKLPQSPEPTQSQRWIWISVGVLALIAVMSLAISFTFLQTIGKPSETATLSTPIINTNTITPFVMTTPAPIETDIQTIPETPIPSTETPTVLTIPLPKSYSQIIEFNNILPFNFSPTHCWTTNSSYESINTSRTDRNWVFQVDKKYSSTDSIQTDFTKCFNDKRATAMGLNFWAQHIKLDSEFGIFVEDSNNHRREYTLWTDSKNDTVYLKVRETDGSYQNYIQLTINPDQEGIYPSFYYQYSVKLFLELNNQGFDVIYINTGSGLKASNADDVNPKQIIRVDGATRPALHNIQKIGLIGYGPDIQIILWPLIFFEDAP